MKLFSLATSVFIAVVSLGGTSGLAAQAGSALQKAKQEAEAKGYIFLSSQEEIVARAKKEGRIRVLSSQDPEAIKAMTKAFKHKYPFIDVRAEEIAGLENYQRILQEMKAGLAKSWDVNYLAFDFYSEFVPYQKKFDILGMAEQGVLQVAPKLVDPVHRHVVAIQSNMQVIAFNKEMISGNRVPESWEGFLAPEFKGKKFLLDVRPKPFAALVPLWGLEKTMDFARKLAAQQPIWYRGEARLLTQMVAGEFPLILGPNYKSVKNAQEKDPKGVLDHKIVDPVPARLSEVQAVLGAAANPHAGLLWLEFQASAEGQKILDEVDFAATIYTPGSVHERLTRGKKVSVLAWEHFAKMGSYEEEIIKAFGFPRAEKK
jgi:ABC-type Fe3+ transport system substrate-binding protein